MASLRYLTSLLALLSANVSVVAALSARELFSRQQQRERSSRASIPSLASRGAPWLDNSHGLNHQLYERDISSRAELYTGSPYLNNDTQNFVVNGSGLPGVSFDIGESYAGLLPISDNANETRKLFFWFFPSSNVNASEEILIWFNGGPGCSSLNGLFHENGPFMWQPGTQNFTANTYSWSNLTNVVYVEQPVGVGFSTGTPNISDEEGMAAEFSGFWKNFVTAFGLQHRKVYVTGESYAGYYAPYVAAAFIDKNDTTYYNLAGVNVIDPIIGDNTIQFEAIITPFAEFWSNVFRFNASFVENMRQQHQACGYADYLSTYFQFPPPPGPFPVLDSPDNGAPCDIEEAIFEAATELNPCFDAYHITTFCPFQNDPFSDWLNRQDVQAAINVVVGTKWLVCADIRVFPPHGDQSVAPAQNGVLQKVIEHTGNVLIGVGSLDFLLPVNGTLFTLQNVTWGGVQGFQKHPSDGKLVVPAHVETNDWTLSAVGTVGSWGTERGLTFYEIWNAGHMLPQYAPGGSYRIIEKLLGRITSLDQLGPFTTQQ